jgi:hypothetical protein
MIRDNIQGKSFKKNYGYLSRCDIEEFLFYCIRMNVNPEYFATTDTNVYLNKKELLQVLQNRIKVLS